MKQEFIKMSGAGNDFIAINNMDLQFPVDTRADFVRNWCRRGLSVGADGVLIVEPPKSADAHFKMRYYNADGSEGETCGNGSRCIARFAHHIGVAPSSMKFETLAGDYLAEVLPNGHVKLNMTDAHSEQKGIRIFDDIFEGEMDFINTGVPHAVIFVDEISTQPVEEAGRHLRYHAEFAPAGTNVNFVQVKDPRNLSVRTYERGVEAETLACGTGCIASSVIAAKNGLVESPVRVQTRGNEYLTIDFTLTENGATRVTLQGSADIVFRGEIEY